MEAWLPFVALGWLAAVIAASIIYRVRAGKPIFPRLPKGALFSERACSGRSLDTLWGRFGGASRCLLVAVTREGLTVSPFFPFNLMFLPEIYGLEHRISWTSIDAVELRPGTVGRKVIITYAAPGLRRIELRVGEPDALIEALRRIRQGR